LDRARVTTPDRPLGSVSQGFPQGCGLGTPPEGVEDEDPVERRQFPPHRPGCEQQPGGFRDQVLVFPVDAPGDPGAVVRLLTGGADQGEPQALPALQASVSKWEIAFLSSK
jgi:hypothetical protein